MIVQTFMAIATAKKTVPTILAFSFFALAVDPTAMSAAIVAVIIAIAGVWKDYLNNRTATNVAAANAAVAAADRAAAAEERKFAAAEAAAERALAVDERRINIAERRVLLERAERNEREVAANTKVTEESAKVISKVSATTETIEGHVNSAATAAVEERKAAEREKELDRRAHEKEVAALRESIAKLEAVATALANSKTLADAVEAAARPSAALPLAVTVAAERLQTSIDENTAATAHLETIASATEDTAKNTADTVGVLRNAVKDGVAEGVKDAASDARDALKEKP